MCTRAHRHTRSNDTLEFIAIEANTKGLSVQRGWQRVGKECDGLCFLILQTRNSVNICNSSLWCEHVHKPANKTANQLKHGLFFGNIETQRMHIYIYSSSVSIALLESTKWYRRSSNDYIAKYSVNCMHSSTFACKCVSHANKSPVL